LAESENPQGDEPTALPPAAREPLADRLMRIRPRERAGPRTTNRVEYQKHWAICEMLVRHDTDEDYCFVFEFHDDVLILDCADNPATAEFVQVKTKTGRTVKWTVAQLTKPDKDSDNDASTSILAKLFHNRQQFDAYTVSLAVISNAPFNFDLREEEGGNDLVLPFGRLPAEKQAAILEHLREVYGPQVEAAQLTALRFERSTLSLDDSPAHTIGRLHAFVERRYPGKRIPVNALYQTLLTEVGSRSMAEHLPQSFNELIRSRSVSRDDFEQHLGSAAIHDDPEQEFQAILASLTDAGWAWPQRVKLRNAWRDYLIHRSNPEHAVTQAAKEWILPTLEDVLSADATLEPDGVVNAVRGILALSGHPRPSGLPDPYLNAIILFEAMEFHARSAFSPVGPTAEEEET
jgi:hypothetical protein